MIFFYSKICSGKLCIIKRHECDAIIRVEKYAEKYEVEGFSLFLVVVSFTSQPDKQFQPPQG